MFEKNMMRFALLWLQWSVGISYAWQHLAKGELGKTLAVNDFTLVACR